MEAETPEGSLRLEPADWVPPPLRRLAHVYRAGRQGKGPELECSCLLREHVTWERDPHVVESDPLYPSHGPCPFDVLRHHCESVLSQNGSVMLACDDNAGPSAVADENDYDDAIVLTDHIQRGRLIFATSQGHFPWRALTVLPVDIVVQASTDMTTPT